MGYGVLHQPNASRRIGAIFARSKNSGCCGEKIGLVECGLVWDVRRVLSDLLYLKIRRGTQVAQGRGLQNLHSWVRIPPAPPGLSRSGPGPARRHGLHNVPKTWVTLLGRTDFRVVRAPES